MLYPELVVKQGKTFTSLSEEAFSVSASHNYWGIEGRFKAVKISYCPDVSKYGRNVAAGQEGFTCLLEGGIVGKPLLHLKYQFKCTFSVSTLWHFWLDCSHSRASYYSLDIYGPPYLQIVCPLDTQSSDFYVIPCLDWCNSLYPKEAAKRKCQSDIQLLEFPN